MKRFLALSLAWLFMAFAHATQAAHTRATLLLSATTAKPGETVLAAVRLQMDPGWHTYWRNGGESGGPTKIEWELPAGVTAGDTQWPVPEKYVAEGLVTFVYHDEAALLVPLKLSNDLKPGTLELKAKVSWLECERVCVPGNQDISAKLAIAGATQPSADAAFIETVKAKLPGDGSKLNVRAHWEKTLNDKTRTVILEWDAPAESEGADFYPDASEIAEISPHAEGIQSESGRAGVRLTIKNFGGDWPKELRGLLINKSGGQVLAFETIAQLTEPTITEKSSQSLGLMLLYAFIGGLILNIMPCVLPVIALKILGFVSQSKESPGRVRALGLLYAAGVLVSFLALAALVIGVKAAGHKAGWGMQFSNPLFVVALTVLVTLVTLNLFGVFEVTLSGRVMGVAGTAASKHGPAGAFFNGVLATILATPCTAPFLGAALGFAFAQSAPIIILTFLTVGLGLAAPYVVLSWHPAWLKFLPKPGAWMERFKVAMGFPMLLTVVWLLSLAATFYGERTWWLAAFLVIVAIAAWVFGQFTQSGNRRAPGLIACALVLVSGYVFVLEGQVHWRETTSTSSSQTKFLAPVAKGYDWEPWSREAVTQARAAGRPVLVDFTAKWCWTCNTVVKPVLQTESVRAKAKAVNAVALLADYTLYPPEITEELARFERAGVPLVLVYPRNPELPAIVLSETPTPGALVEALEKAGK